MTTLRMFFCLGFLCAGAMLVRAQGEGPACTFGTNCNEPATLQWQGPLTAQVDLNFYNECGSGCEGIVTYYWRQPCHEACEVYVEKVEMLDPDHCTCSADGRAAVRAAIADLLTQTPLNLSGSCYPQPSDGCYYGFEVGTGACWRPLLLIQEDFWATMQTGHPVYDTTLVGWETCNDDICCIGVYQICVTPSGYSFLMVSSFAPEVDCNALPGPESERCSQFCEALPPAGETPVIMGKRIDETGEERKQGVRVTPNPTSGALTVTIDPALLGAVGGTEGQLAIFTGSGERIREETVTLGEKPESLPVSTNGLPGGVYYISLQLPNGGGRSITTFVLQR